MALYPVIAQCMYANGQGPYFEAVLWMMAGSVLICGGSGSVSNI